jgi:hypothetical protein
VRQSARFGRARARTSGLGKAGMQKIPNSLVRSLSVASASHLSPGWALRVNRAWRTLVVTGGEHADEHPPIGWPQGALRALPANPGPAGGAKALGRWSLVRFPVRALKGKGGLFPTINNRRSVPL